MGSDHDKFSDRLFTDTLGLSSGMMDDHGEGAFMKTSAPSEAAKKAEALEKEAAEVKKKWLEGKHAMKAAKEKVNENEK